MAMIITDEGYSKFYSDLSGKELDPSEMVLMGGSSLVSYKEFCELLKIDTFPKTEEGQGCSHCGETEYCLYYIGEEDKYLCEDCFDKWMKENDYITNENEIENFYDRF